MTKSKNSEGSSTSGMTLRSHSSSDLNKDQSSVRYCLSCIITSNTFTIINVNTSEYKNYAPLQLVYCHSCYNDNMYTVTTHNRYLLTSSDDDGEDNSNNRLTNEANDVPVNKNNNNKNKNKKINNKKSPEIINNNRDTSGDIINNNTSGNVIINDTSANKKKSINPPPIVINNEQIKDKLAFHSEIATLTNHKFAIKPNNKNTRVIPQCDEQRQIIINYLNEKQIEYYSFTDAANQTKKIILKSGSYFTADDISSDLTNNKINHIRVKQLKNKKGVISGSFLVYLNSNMSLKQVKEVKYLNNVKVQWQNYVQPNRVAQCFRCQQFGHGSSNCKLTPRCVKCAEPHLTTDCAYVKDQHTPKCANCSENHTANYTKCAKRTDYITKTQDRAKTNQPKKFSKTSLRPGISFADATSAGVPTPDESSPHCASAAGTSPPSAPVAGTYSSPVPAAGISSSGLPRSSPSRNFNPQEILTVIQQLRAIDNLEETFHLLREITQVISTTHSTSERAYAILNLCSKYP